MAISGFGGGSHDGGKARGAAIDELNTALPHNGIVSGSKPDLSGLDITIFPEQIKVRVLDIADGFHNFFRQNRSHPGIEGMPQVGHMNAALDVGRQQLLTAGEHLFGIAEFFHLDAQDGINDWQIVSGIGEGQRLVGTILVHRPFELAVRLGNDIVGTLNRSKSD